MINTRKIAFQGVRIKKEHHEMPYTPSLIQTILSVPELRRFLLPQQLADYTAGGDFHRAPMTKMRLFSTSIVPRRPAEVNTDFQLYSGAVFVYNIP